MFLLRSAFWLTVAFILIAPKDVDLGQKAQDMSTQAIAAGQQLIVSQILSAECSTLECAGGKAVDRVVDVTAGANRDGRLGKDGTDVDCVGPRGRQQQNSFRRACGGTHLTFSSASVWSIP